MRLEITLVTGKVHNVEIDSTDGSTLLECFTLPGWERRSLGFFIFTNLNLIKKIEFVDN